MRAAIDDVCSQPVGSAFPTDKLRGEKTVTEMLALLAAVIDAWRCPVAGIGPRFTDWMEHGAAERRYHMLKDRVGRLTDDDLPVVKGWLAEGSGSV